MQRKWTYKNNVNCYGNIYIQCLPYKKIVHWGFANPRLGTTNLVNCKLIKLITQTPEQ